MVVAAIYARTSTSLQQSCPTQLALCRKLATERGYKIRYQLMDQGERGSDNERPHYQRLLELAENQQINVIIVWKLDRLFRSLKEASIAQERFTSKSVHVVSVTEPFDTTSTIGRFVFGFLANVAQFETDLIRERAYLGFERRVRQGKWTGAKPPFGYTKNPEGFLTIDSSEAKILKEMQAMYCKSGGDADIARRLQATGKKCREKEWTKDLVRRALTNPIIIGTLRQRGIQQHFPALQLIPTKEWSKLEDARKKLQYLGKQNQAKNHERLDAILNDYHQYLKTAEADAN